MWVLTCGLCRWYNDTGAQADTAADRAHFIDTDLRNPFGQPLGGAAGAGLGASSAWQEREITLDSLLGSQLDGMADSVNVASKNRLERMLGQITQGNPSSMHPTTLHGASAVGQQLAVERRGQVHGGGGALANPFACGLELSMDSMGPGGKEEALFSQAVRQELAIASGDEL